MLTLSLKQISSRTRSGHQGSPLADVGFFRETLIPQEVGRQPTFLPQKLQENEESLETDWGAHPLCTTTFVNAYNNKLKEKLFAKMNIRRCQRLCKILTLYLSASKEYQEEKTFKLLYMALCAKSMGIFTHKVASHNIVTEKQFPNFTILYF